MSTYSQSDYCVRCGADLDPIADELFCLSCGAELCPECKRVHGDVCPSCSPYLPPLDELTIDLL
jgi:predicted amidophosphoribosyltransferase